MKVLEKAALAVALDEVLKQKANSANVLEQVRRALGAIQAIAGDLTQQTYASVKALGDEDQEFKRRIDQLERLIVLHAITIRDVEVNVAKPTALAPKLPTVVDEISQDENGNWIVHYTDGRKKKFLVKKPSAAMFPYGGGGGSGGGLTEQQVIDLIRANSEVFEVESDADLPDIGYPAIAFSMRDLTAYGYPIEVARLKVNSVG